MSWTDEEIDKLFKESASEVSFKYDNAYFKEFEAASLPVNKKGKDFLWMGTALVFIGVLTSAYLYTNGKESLSTETTTKLVAGIEEKGAVDANAQESADNNTNGSANASAEDNVTAASSQDAVNTPAGSTIVGSSSTNRNGSQSVENPVRSSIGGSGAITQPTLISGGSSEIPASIQLLETMSTLQGAENDGAIASTEVEAVSELTPNKAVEIEHTVNPEMGALNGLPLMEFTPKTAFYLEATGGVSQSLVTPSENFSNSYGGGFGWETHFGKFSLNTGLNFNVSNHQDLELTRAWKIYSFGSTSGLDSYDYKNVYAIEMPISMGYNFGKHRLTLGVRPSVIIGAKIDHQTFENEILTRSERIYGLAGGLQRFGLKPTIGYSFHIQQKWTVGMNVGIQLLQAVNEEYINGFNNPYPIDGQIYLRRTLRLRNY